jgi:predicted enzyme related to lactoylglutathione lyase
MSLLVNIDVEDLEKATAFYCAALGLRVGRRFDGAVELLGSTAPVYLLEKAAGSSAASTTDQQRDYRRHWTPVHLDFAVPDIVAALERAKAAGASVESEIKTSAWGRLVLLADPFGNGFCLLQFLGRGYDEITLPTNTFDPLGDRLR